MANGPFGNPLSTGIALSFEVDMTPYREMHKRKLLAAKEKEEDQKKKQQQYADILKNITPPDASKIHKKYMPEVQNQYAELIDSAMGYINKNDMASLHKHMFGFKSNAEKAVQATENYKNYVNSDANKTFKSIEAIRSMEDDNTALSQIAKDYENDVEYGDGYLFWSTIERPDLLGNANKVLQGTEKMFMTDDAGNYISTGKVGPRGKELYRKSIKDPDKFFENQATLLKNSAGGNRLLMEYGGIKASQLDERQADGRQLRDVLSDRLVRETLSPKVYGEEGLDPNVPRADKTGGEKTFEEKYKVDKEPTFVDIEVDQNSGIPANSKLIGIPFNPLHDVNSTKWDYRKTIEISDGSYQTVGGRPIDKPASRGPGVKETGAVPMGLYALQGPSDKRVYAGYLFKRRVENGPEVNVMHYQPLDANSLDQQYVREFIDASGISVDDYIEYYDKVAKKAGFPVSSYGGSSAAGTGSQSSKSSSSSVSITSLDIKKMSGMKYGDFKDASNKAWVEETAKKIRAMGNLDDLWKQTGKSGTPNGQSNAELLAGFVESGKTSLLTGTPGGANTPTFQ
jgi:hypothetical protein